MAITAPNECSENIFYRPIEPLVYLPLDAECPEDDCSPILVTHEWSKKDLYP